MYAADAGHLRLCEQLVKHGADAAAYDTAGYDAAGWARSAGHTDCEEFLTSKTTDALSSPVAQDYAIDPEALSSPTVVPPESASKTRRKDREDALHEQIRELSITKASLATTISLVNADAEKAQMRAERADGRHGRRSTTERDVDPTLRALSPRSTSRKRRRSPDRRPTPTLRRAMRR